MAYDIIVLKNDSDFNVENKELFNNYPYAKQLNINSPTIFSDIIKSTVTSLIWIILPNVEILNFDFNFNYELDDFEKKIVNVFTSEYSSDFTICLTNRKVIQLLSKTSNNFYDLFKTEIKLHEKKIGFTHTDLDIIVLKNDSDFNVENKELFNNYPYAKQLNINSPTIFSDIIKSTVTSLIWIILPNVEILNFDFNFNYELDDFEKKIVNVFTSEYSSDFTICLTNRKVIQLLSKTSNNFYDLFKTEIKLHEKKIGFNHQFTCIDSDIVFISYDEKNAQHHYAELLGRFSPFRIKRVHGVTGILAAHRMAALLSNTQFFYVIDADAELIPEFNFDYEQVDRRYVHIWFSRNPINGLEYGYGGVKMFHKSMFLGKDLDGCKSIIDMSTSISEGIKLIPMVSCVTRFNTDPFSAWRAAFRECTKLSSNLIDGCISEENEQRLKVWTTVANPYEPFHEECLRGAQEGKDFGTRFRDKREILNKINDFDWLHRVFEDGYDLCL